MGPSAIRYAGLAARIGYTPRHLSRVLTQELGAGPLALARAKRAQTARVLLETTELTVAAVARTVGLKHSETLHRAFARRVGTTPDRYRQHFARRAS